MRGLHPPPDLSIFPLVNVIFCRPAGILLKGNILPAPTGPAESSTISGHTKDDWLLDLAASKRSEVRRKAKKLISPSISLLPSAISNRSPLFCPSPNSNLTVLHTEELRFCSKRCERASADAHPQTRTPTSRQASRLHLQTVWRRDKAASNAQHSIDFHANQSHPIKKGHAV